MGGEKLWNERKVPFWISLFCFPFGGEGVLNRRWLRGRERPSSYLMRMWVVVVRGCSGGIQDVLDLQVGETDRSLCPSWRRRDRRDGRYECVM